MYQPPHFRTDDPAIAAESMRRHPFAGVASAATATGPGATPGPPVDPFRRAVEGAMQQAVRAQEGK